MDGNFWETWICQVQSCVLHFLSILNETMHTSINFLPKVSFHDFWKHQKTSGFLRFSGGYRIKSGIKWVINVGAHVNLQVNHINTYLVCLTHFGPMFSGGIEMEKWAKMRQVKLSYFFISMFFYDIFNVYISFKLFSLFYSLAFFYSHWKYQKPLSLLLETLQNQRFSDDFRGCRKRPVE